MDKKPILPPDPLEAAVMSESIEAARITESDPGVQGDARNTRRDQPQFAENEGLADDKTREAARQAAQRGRTA